jgi:hypothetical protein
MTANTSDWQKAAGYVTPDNEVRPLFCVAQGAIGLSHTRVLIFTDLPKEHYHDTHFPNQTATIHQGPFAGITAAIR